MKLRIFILSFVINIVINGSAFALPDPSPAPSVASFPSECDLDLQNASAIDLRLGAIANFVRNIDPKLAALETLPTWQNIEDLKTQIQNLKDLKTDLTAKNILADAVKRANDSLAAFQADSKFSAMIAEIKSAIHSSDYLPTEYELKSLYSSLLYELDRELPASFRIPIRHLPYDQRAPQLIAKAEKLMRDQEIRFKQNFSTTGFASFRTFNQALLQYSSDAQVIYQWILNEKVEFAMNRPEGARWWVPKVGFQNQRQSGSSGGSFDPDHRNHVEAALTGTAFSVYLNYDNELKPEYGYLRPAPELGLVQSEAANQYGSDIYIFKKDRVRRRVSWTPGDSFGFDGLVNISDPEHPITSGWEGFFIPWEDRALLVPDLIQNYKNGKMGFEAAPLTAPEGTPPLTYPPYPMMPPGQPLAPTNPPDPKQPQPPVVPTPPPPPPGEDPAKTAANASAFYSAYYNTAAYRDAEADYSTKLNAYWSGPDYAAYNKAYFDSPAYKKYLVDEAAYEATPAYKKYSDDVTAYSTLTAQVEQKMLTAGLVGTSLEKLKITNQHYGYIELQYFGPLTLDDVEIFEYKGNPPTGEFLHELQKRGIIIRDGRPKDVPATDAPAVG